jgi:hypothetical protein
MSWQVVEHCNDQDGLSLSVECWNLIKDPLTPSISPEFYSRADRGGSSNMVSEPEGLEFEPQPRIFRHV